MDQRSTKGGNRGYETSRQQKEEKINFSFQPFLSRINSKYDFVIQGPLMPILNASSPTVY